MAEIRHLIPREQVDHLNKVKHILGDPMKMHKGRFVEYLEYLAPVLYDTLVEKGVSHDDAVAMTAAKLHDLNKEWKAAAQAKFMARQAKTA